jgi:type I restriction enzyme, R subunit
VQIGLTATPRQLEILEKSGEAEADAKITADNLRYFGEPAYEYSIGQGIEVGYLAACEIVKRDVFLDGYAETQGIRREGLVGKTLIDAHTGEPLALERDRDFYASADFEAWLLMPERVDAMCADLFESLLATGGPEQRRSFSVPATATRTRSRRL